MARRTFVPPSRVNQVIAAGAAGCGQWNRYDAGEFRRVAGFRKRAAGLKRYAQTKIGKWGRWSSGFRRARRRKGARRPAVRSGKRDAFDLTRRTRHFLAMDTSSLSRRVALAGCAAGTVTSAMAGRAGAAPSPAAASLDRLAWRLLAFDPGEATRLGLDTGAHAALRGRLDDRSPAGVEARRRFLSAALAALARVPRAGLAPATLTSLAVAESAFRTASDGMKLPYGVAAIGSWRHTPYGVIQNVGAWLDVPQLLDGDQPVKTSADGEAYCARLAAMAGQLDGETARIAAARRQGLTPPSFLLDKTIAGMTGRIAAAAKADGPLVGPLVRKAAAAGLSGDWGARAARI